jgi:hypothetical protein
MSMKRRKTVVRTLERFVFLTSRRDRTSVSGRQDGRLANQIRSGVRRLRRLLRDDPDDLFWGLAQRVVVKIASYLLRG